MHRFAVVILGALLIAPAWNAEARSASASATAHNDLKVVDAVTNGNLDALRALLRQHADVNASRADGTTPLHIAAERDDVVMAKMLIAAGARATAANRFSATPLALAAVNGSARMIALLIEAGADPNATLPGGE